ncbi:putative autophagy-related protein 11 [Capsicum annuum]|uniref:putative autophagy-related protein 11 n=1 Tax=Capsicum annuum TaxID=4072 RepID=UPI0007BEF747|nr:putative autophagy-related protein 11 [Capsicum annuum]
MVSADPATEEFKREIPMLDLTENLVKKKKNKGKKKEKGKRERPDNDKERKAEKRERKKSENEKMKKEKIESLVDNERWEAAIEARAIGASTSRPSETVDQLHQNRARLLMEIGQLRMR